MRLTHSVVVPLAQRLVVGTVVAWLLTTAAYARGTGTTAKAVGNDDTASTLATNDKDMTSLSAR